MAFGLKVAADRLRASALQNRSQKGAQSAQFPAKTPQNRLKRTKVFKQFINRFKTAKKRKTLRKVAQKSSAWALLRAAAAAGAAPRCPTADRSGHFSLLCFQPEAVRAAASQATPPPPRGDRLRLRSQWGVWPRRPHTAAAPQGPPPSRLPRGSQRAATPASRS